MSVNFDTNESSEIYLSLKLFSSEQKFNLEKNNDN